MPVSLAQWRGEIGAFYTNTFAFSKISTFYLLLLLPYVSIFCRLDLIKLLFLIISLILNGIMFFHLKRCRNNNLKIGVYLFTTIYLLIISNLLEYLWVASRITNLSGDIEINPGPKSNPLNRCFSICHWNLNSISTHMFTKVSLLSAYISVQKFDIICVSETNHNSEIPSDDENLEIPGYNLVREDHPSDSERGGLNLSIFYPPLYERTVWYYERANTELIRRAIDQFDWVRALFNVNVDEKIYFFTKTLLNIIQNFMPHETIICDDRDPPWINKEIKKLMLEKNLAFKSYCCFNKSMFLSKPYSIN